MQENAISFIMTLILDKIEADFSPQPDKCTSDTEQGFLCLNTNGPFIPESQFVCKLWVCLTIPVSCSFSKRLSS